MNYSRHVTSQLDICNILREASTVVYSKMGLPSSIFTTNPEDIEKCKFVTENPSLELQTAYGNVPFIPDSRWKAVTVGICIPLNPLVNTNFRKDIEAYVTDSIESVSQADADCATLTIDLGKIFFFVDRNLSNSQQGAFLTKGQPFVQDRLRSRFCRVTCEYENPNDLVRLLCDHGAVLAFQEKEESRLHFTLRGKFIKNKRGFNQTLYFDNQLNLNPQTLAVECWRVQNWYPMTYQVMHAQPSANDVVIRAHVERFVSVNDFRRRCPENVPSMLTEPGMDGCLERSQNGYRWRRDDSSLRFICERGTGRKFGFRLMDVPFTLIVQPVKYYFFDKESLEFVLNDELTCEPTLHFPLSTDRRRLIDAATQVAHLLWMNGNNQQSLPSLNTPQYHYEGQLKIPSEEIYSVLRLRDKDGPLRHLLGIEGGSGVQCCREKYSEMQERLVNIRCHRWVTQMSIDVDALLAKLRNAAYEMGINQ